MMDIITRPEKTVIIDLDDVNFTNARDVLDATADGVYLALGGRPRNPHPNAEFVAESPLRVAAYAAGTILNPRQPGEVEAAVIGRGLRTMQFGNAVAAGLQAVARERFDLQAQHLGFVAKAECTRLGEPEALGAVDASGLFTDVGDGREYQTSRALLRDGETITLSSLGRLLHVSREVVFNDDLGLLEEAVAAMGVAAARHEARLVAAALETAGNLSDDSAVFDVAHGNYLATAGALSSSSTDAALMALRTMPAADGEALDAAAAHLVVPPGLELLARQIVNSGLPVSVNVLPGMALDRFYFLANQAVERNIAVARLSGQTHPLAVEPVKTPIGFDGAMLRIRIDTGAAMVGRRGIVRCS